MDLMQASSVDPAALKEDAARAKEMVAIISHAKKAEDRRERLMKNAKTPSQVRTLEKRFVVERRQDAQRIRDLERAEAGQARAQRADLQAQLLLVEAQALDGRRELGRRRVAGDADVGDDLEGVALEGHDEVEV